MPHIFTLDDLARSKVCLEFVNQEQPPSIYWQPRVEPLSLNSSTTLSLRVNQTFVNGRPSLTMFLIHDPESTSQTQAVRHHVSSRFPFRLSNTMPKATLVPSAAAVIDSLPSNTDNAASSQENLPSASDSNFSLFAHSNTAVSTPSLDFDFPPPYPTNWPRSDAHKSPDAHSRDLPSSSTTGELDPKSDPKLLLTPDAQILQSIDRDSNNSASELFSSFDMFFGTHGGCGPSPKWPSDPSPTPSPSTSVLDFGSSEGGWSDQSDCADSVVAQDSAELTNVNRTGSVNGGRVPRRRSTNPSGGVQPRTNGTNKKRKRFQCSLCDETFSRRHDMMRHESNQHGKKQDWTCEMCRRFFSSEAMLTIHNCPALRS
ncbi:hypothetical protein VKT23_014864 [Stygiomarasmius scandens]|uniref:C2H2-type domain-containing protein n=1 Tax=Marasmiellus scandens TaxID=2682957 RepID=A0ABR1J0Q8_9AGAR